MTDDERLSEAMATAIHELERDGGIVVTSPRMEPLADRLAKAARTVVPSTDLSLGELHGVQSLIRHAIADERFFDWEMPILTGFSATEFESIAKKLPPSST